MTHLRALSAIALLAAGPAASAHAFGPGEETVFQVRYLDVLLGVGRITVGAPAGGIWPVIFQARTDGVGGLVDVREHLVTYWDSALNLPRGFDLRSYETGDYHTDSIRFDRANGKATAEQMRHGLRTVRTLDIPPDVQDLTSALMWLRLQPLAPGQRYEVPVCTGYRKFTLVAEVLERETLATPAGTFAALKLRVRTALVGPFATRRDSFLWLSDDPRHFLVQFSAEFAMGSMVARLTRYRPGTEVSAR